MAKLLAKIAPKDVVDYALLIMLFVLIIGYAFGVTPATRNDIVVQLIWTLLVGYGFKKVPA